MIQKILRTPFKDQRNYDLCLYLILFNVAIHIVFEFLPPRTKYLFCLIPYYCIEKHCFWQVASYMFFHANFSHLFFNMLGLLFFGVATEKALGSKEFLLLYIVCGIFSGLVSLGIYVLFGAWGVCLLGASGAIYAILLSFAVLFPNATIFIWGIVPIPAPILVAIYAIMCVGGIFFGAGDVANSTHLAGFLGAWLYFLVRMGISPIRVWKAHIR